MANTFGRMLNNANVVGMPDGTWYEPKSVAVRPYRITAVPGQTQLGCCAGMGTFDLTRFSSTLFSFAVPVALGAGALILISMLSKKK